jgi:hypothetical protein
VSEHKHYISIWFFIGALLLVYGVLIAGAEIYGMVSPPPNKPVLAELHAGLWWGIFLIVLGGFYSIHFRPGKE